MGRTSKFSFPIPGRSKHTATTKEKASQKERFEAPLRSPLPNGLSKAQRILGADSDLNIDAPGRDDDAVSWRYPSSRSSGMSISISESTNSMQPTSDTGSLHDGSDQWDRESGVLPKSRIRGKASSTLLGQTYREDGATDRSSINRHMRHEDSSSTLKSYYDRQKSPLAISQQTSESSARDLALRKGQPPVIPLARSPLLQVESTDIFAEQFGNGSNNGWDVSRDTSMRKKPARLDLSMLFPSRSKRDSKMSNVEALTPSSAYSNASTTGSQDAPARRKLVKVQSKESLRSQHLSFRSAKSHDPRPQRGSKDTLSNLYDSYEQSPVASPMSRIPETRVPDPDPIRWNGNRAEGHRHEPTRDSSRPHSKSEHRTKSRESQNLPANDSHARRKMESYAQPRQLHAKDQEPMSPANKEPFSWQHMRENMINPPWDSSAASISSRNTKTSRHTSASAFSNSDLKQSSVLSLSSDSEEDVFDQEAVRSPAGPSNDKTSRMMKSNLNRAVEARRQSPQLSERTTSKKHSSRKGGAQASPFLTIPETSTSSSRLSGPWSPPKLDNSHSVAPIRAEKGEKRTKRTQSTSTRSSTTQPTPPQSPASDPLRDVETDSSRFMAVTKQEEALLEALRQKRTRMREAIIEEHETQKSPPRAPNRKISRHSGTSSVGKDRMQDSPNDKHRILLYLDTPLDDGNSIDTAEPSPDLSDFLSFGSDEDSTPRTSWAPPRRGQPRPDSENVLENQKHKISPRTPPSVARLSAVGSSVGFRSQRVSDASLGAKKRDTQSGVRTVNDTKLMHQQDYMLEDAEEGVIWGLR
ncbi:hypothetical protein D0Z07_4783 [Hyphodiscus hymeniophilus]|uniref:Uncharacterized protein n=1 Tax=Hyphodiscus hymeniophilus TaxID=353542 RepID=A0A9P6VIR5_9HELO|nr:hypothetical protein D0Z07_4783 [Hyphodiscus hymeniophilus]